MKNLLVLVMLFPLVSAAQIQSLSWQQCLNNRSRKRSMHGDVDLACGQ